MTAETLPRRDPGRTLADLNAALDAHFAPRPEPITGEITRIHDPLTAPVVDLGVWQKVWDRQGHMLLGFMAIGWREAYNLLATLVRLGPDAFDKPEPARIDPEKVHAAAEAIRNGRTTIAPPLADLTRDDDQDVTP